MPTIKSEIGSIKRISLDDVCFLISTSKSTLAGKHDNDDVYQCFCSKLSISRQEFFNAGQLGFKPQILIVVNSDEYDGQKTIEYDKKRYAIYKCFQRSDGYTELYCEIRGGER